MKVYGIDPSSACVYRHNENCCQNFIITLVDLPTPPLHQTSLVPTVLPLSTSPRMSLLSPLPVSHPLSSSSQISVLDFLVTYISTLSSLIKSSKKSPGECQRLIRHFCSRDLASSMIASVSFAIDSRVSLRSFCISSMSRSILSDILPYFVSSVMNPCSV